MANANSTENSLIVRTYEHDGQFIPVSFTNEAFFNATAVAKVFGKRPADWLRTDDTKAYIEAIGRKCVIKQDQLVSVVSGSPETGGGTWLHPKLGIPFARWLSPDFAVWADFQVEEILRSQQAPQFDLSAMTTQALRQLANTIEENAALKTRIQIMQPKEEFFDHVVGTASLFSLKDAAQSLRTGQKRLVDKLVEWKFFNKERRPYQKYLDKGYFQIVPVPVHQGKFTFFHPQPMVTGKGMTIIKGMMDATVMSQSKEMVKV
jgi:phage antirepressor YoqD-like protein